MRMARPPHTPNHHAIDHKEFGHVGKPSWEGTNLHLEDTMRRGMARPPNTPSHHTTDHEEVYSRLR